MTVVTTLILVAGLAFCASAQQERPSGRQKGSQEGVRPAEARPPSPSTKAVRQPSEAKSRSQQEPQQPRQKDTRMDSSVDGRPVQQPAGVSRAESGQRKRMFETVRQGLNTGRISSFSDLMGPQVHIDLRGAENGLYSSSQAYYLLEDYLRTRRLSGLEFTSGDEAGAMPYATGSAGFDHKGSREQAQVYVSLSQVGERWVISQIKIY